MSTPAFRILWTKPERRQVMSEVLRLKNNGGANMTRGELLIEAQKVLPQDRRTPPRSPTFLISFFRDMEHLIASKAITPAATPPPKDAPAAAPVAATSADDEGPEIIVITETKVVKEPPDFGKLSTETLIAVLCERLRHLETVAASADAFTNAVNAKRTTESAYDRRLDTRPPAAQPPPPEPEPIRISIIGLLPDQQHFVEEKTANAPKPVKLRFHDSNTGSQVLPTRTDYVIAARFVRHSWWDRAKAALPSNRIFFLDGGLQSIVQKVFDICALQKTAL